MEVATSHRRSENRGQAFLLQLATRGMILPRDVRVFVCPRDPGHSRVDDPEFPKKLQSVDLRNPDPALTSYAVRDFARQPIAPHASGKEPWVLCPWHRDGIPVLYDDGSVVFHRREDLGLRPGESLVLGPDAKSELLRKFLPLQR